MTKHTNSAAPPPKPVFDMDAVILSSNTGVCLDRIMHLLWRDYDFETGCLYLHSSPFDSGVKLFLSANMQELIRHRYEHHFSRFGQAPRQGDYIFNFERDF